jgi:uncharacterized membrane protein YphA (DoxX/SURF4 family)
MRLAAHPWIGTVFRFVLAGVLLYAGGIKMIEPNGARDAINAYRVFPPSWAPTLGYALPLAEIGLGLLLAAGIYVRASAVATAVLMVAFIAGIASVWARGYSIDCGCFGGGGDISPAGRAARYTQEIARDLLFTGLAVWLAKWPRSRWALERG